MSGCSPAGAGLHVPIFPALQALPDLFEIAGVANSSRASAEAAAVACGIPRAFEGVSKLVNSPDIDVVAITVKVPHHFELVQAAIEAGKHVYCEWPLGNGLAEAEEMAARLKAKGLMGVVGNQARVAPEILYLRQLLADGFTGDVPVGDHLGVCGQLGRVRR